MDDKIVVIGGSGWIGRAVVAAASQQSIRVINVGRSDCDNQRFQFISGDIIEPEFVSLSGNPVFANCRAIIHCAGLAHVDYRNPDTAIKLDQANRVGTQHVMEFARRSGIGRVVYASSISVYDWRCSSPRREESALRPLNAYSTSKAAGERACLESGMDVCVARLGTVFGPGDRANFARLASAMARGTFVLPGRAQAKKSILPCGLAAELLVSLAQLDAVPSVVNLALPEAPSLDELCRAFSEFCGFLKPKRLPLSVMRGVALVGDAMRVLSLNVPLTTDTLNKLTLSTDVDVGRMMKTWPMRVWPTFRQAVEDAATFYRSV